MNHRRKIALLGGVVLLAGNVLLIERRDAQSSPHTFGHGASASEIRLAPTPEAEEVLRTLRQAGLPIENARPYIRHEADPDGLLGRASGYRSKVVFEDARVDGGQVADNDPGSVALGGAIEVYSDAEAARKRAEQLRRDAYGIPSRTERHYLGGKVLLRISPYLAEERADRYGAALGAAELPPPSPPSVLRQV
ncbi:hypothetical protein [Streptomyces sp. KL2]|uniref:hypothetical protein n=1 Tax=Streptomyces sp. KL2 TaxID=3050126 RepID=UPI00397A9B28